MRHRAHRTQEDIVLTASTSPGNALLERRFAVPVVLLLIIAGFYWKLVLTYQFDWMWSPDMSEQLLPWFEEETRQMQHSRFPLWDPHVWDGQPLLAQAQPGAAYPPNWLFFFMPRRHGHINVAALEWYYVLERWMAACFCYLLCRDLGCSRGASIIGGLIFALAGYVGTNDWPQMVNGAVWAPLVFMFVMRAGRGYRPVESAAWGGLFWGVSWLSGHHQVPILISLSAGGLWLFYILRERRINWPMVKLAAISAVIMLMVGALQTLPATEYGRISKRWTGALEPTSWKQSIPYYVHTRYSLKVHSLFGLIFPGIHETADPFVGVAALAMAMVGVAAAWRMHATKVLTAIAIGGIIYSLGVNSVFQGVLYAAMPMVEKARAPSMAVAIFSVGVAGLVALGTDRVAELREERWFRRLTAGVAGLGLFVWALMVGAIFINHLSWPPVDDRVGITGMCAILVALLLYGWRLGNVGRRTAMALFGMLMLLEAGNVAAMNFADRNDAEARRFLDQTWGHEDIARYLNSQAKPFRVNVQEEALAPNWAEFHNLDGYTSYTATLTTNFMNVEFYSPQTRKLFGVGYTVARQPDVPDAQVAFEGDNGIKVFRNPGVFPRAWAVHEVVHLNSWDEGIAMIRDHVDDLRSKAMMMKAGPALKPCSSGSDDVQFARYDPERVTIRANLACDGMVVLSDNYYPGWKATVDGRSVRISEVNLAMRGVLVPAGAHDVEFKYRPASVYAGASLSLLGVVGACVIASFGRRRWNNPLTYDAKAGTIQD